VSGERWCVISDDSGHDYLCPVGRRDEAVRRLEAIEAYWAKGNPRGKPPSEPDFVTRIDGIGSLTFTDPQEDA
jgi:hypothetical protein